MMLGLARRPTKMLDSLIAEVINMRSTISQLASFIFVLFLSTTALAQESAQYSTDSTDIGTLLDDPAAAAIVEKHLPGFTTDPQTAMARTFTLPALQSFVPDTVTDEVLEQIDADLAALPGK